MTGKASKGESAKRAAAPPKGVSRKVLVDGANVLFASGSKPKLKNLQLVMRKLEEEGRWYIVFADASVKYKLGKKEKPVFERMISEEMVQQVPAGTPADRWILEYASRHPDCKILSNDTFREWEGVFPFAGDQERFIRFMIVGDEVMLGVGHLGPSPVKVDVACFTDACLSDYLESEGFREGELDDYEDEEIFKKIAPEVFKIAPRTCFYEEIHDLLVKGEVQTVGIFAFGQPKADKNYEYEYRSIPAIKEEAEELCGAPIFGGTVYIEKTVPLVGLWKGRPVPGIEIILRKRGEPKRKSKPATEPEAFLEDIRELYRRTSLEDIDYDYDYAKAEREGKRVVECFVGWIPGTDCRIFAKIKIVKGILGGKKGYKPLVEVIDLSKHSYSEKINHKWHPERLEYGPKFERFFDAWRWAKALILEWGREEEWKGRELETG
jgi:hypothetical protein